MSTFAGGYGQRNINLAPFGNAIGDCADLVGPEGSGCEFTSVQAAINKFRDEGGDPDNPGAIIVLPGDYEEDVDLAPGLSITGLCDTLPLGGGVPETCRIIGRLTADYSFPGPFGVNSCSIANIDIMPPSGPAIVFEGADLQVLRITNSTVVSIDDTTVVMTNTGVNGTDRSRLQWDNVSGVARSGSGALVLDQDAGEFQANRFQLIQEDGVFASALAVDISGGVFNATLEGGITGGLSISGGVPGTPHNFLRTFFDNGAQPTIAMTAAGVVLIIIDATVFKAIPGLAFTGVPGTTMAYSDIIYTSVGSGIDTAITAVAFPPDGIVPQTTPPVVVAGPYASRGFEIVRAVTAGITISVSLPPLPLARNGTIVTVKDFAGVAGGAYAPGEGLSVVPAGGTIDGGAGPFVFSSHRQSQQFVFDGTSDWMTIG